MIKEKFENIYRMFRMEFYKHLFSIVKEREGSLSAVELSSTEVIFLLGSPTIKEFADFLEISQPNATYKIKMLVEKGYIKKIPSEADGREYSLSVTDKFLKYYSANNTYGDFIWDKMKDSLTEDEILKIDGVLNLLSEKVFSDKK